MVTATIEPIPLKNVARELSFISREELERLPAPSVSDALRFLPSVEVRARGAFGAQVDFQIRGASFGQSLVLVDGVRLNDAQSGHHNADFPVSLDDVERVEVLRGIGSSLHGADAFGGTIQLVTRGVPGLRATLTAGSFGSRAGRASARARRAERTLDLSFSLSHTDGFMPERDADEGLARVRLQDARHSLMVAHLDKEFGAAGFYGPAPSREWTQQTLVTAARQLGALDLTGASGSATIFYRRHTDHFIYNRFNPALSENRHKTHAIGADLRAGRAVGSKLRLAAGLSGGSDRVRSSNLGDHSYIRGSVFGEAQIVAGRAFVYPGVRFDSYQHFGSSVSPSLAMARPLGRSLTLRASAGRAFRVPTYTELYYRDPNNEGSGDLTPERAWSAEGGVEWQAAERLAVHATAFSRWDEAVIDWVRASPAMKWRSENLRDVTTKGIEFEGRLTFERGALSLGYTGLRQSSSVEAAFSKYVLDFARRSFAATLSGNPGAGFSGGVSLSYKLRQDGRSYWIVDARMARAFGRVRLFVDGLNLLDEDYQEVKGVDLPGRSVSFGISVFGGRGSRP